MHKKHIKTILLAPALLILAVTTLYPFFNALITSFRVWHLDKTVKPGPFIGFENYIRVFQDANFLNSVYVTVVYTVISVVLSIVVAMMIALLLHRPGRLNTFFKIFLILPYAMAPALKGFSWRFMLNPYYGIIDALLDKMMPWMSEVVWLGDPGWALFWLAITEVWGWAPYIGLVFIGALDSLPTQLFDVSKVDGANTMQTFYYITLPMMRPIIVMVTLLKTIFSVRQFDAVVTMTGGGPGRSTETVNYFVYKTGFRFFDMGYASAMAYLLVAGLFIFAYFYVKNVVKSEN
jgi:multiple sugar transport system permease protein